jgi:DNA-binding transcriptional ArsR family regulator
VLILSFGPDDAARCRFSVSPLWETASAVRVLTSRRLQAYHLPWLDGVRPRLAGLDLTPLLTLMPRRGYTPDFLSPVPAGPQTTAADQLEQIRTTSPGQVAYEISRSLTDRAGEPVQARAAGLLADPLQARQLLADLLGQCWRLLVADDWPRLKDLLDADIAYQTRRLGERGLQRLFAELHSNVSWAAGAVHIKSAVDQALDLGGRGLVLMPSIFVWPDVIAVLDPPWQPTLVYPARGIGELWHPTRNPHGDALARLLGATRATLLSSLAAPSSTTALARRHHLSPAAVSEHVVALHAARLVSRERRGRSVLYRQTRLGAELARTPSARTRR